MNKITFSIFIVIMVILNYIKFAYSTFYSSGSLSSMQDLSRICRVYNLPYFKTIGELHYWKSNNHRFGQSLYIFGESITDLSLWLSHVKADNLEERTLFQCHVESLLVRFTDVLENDDVPLQIQQDYNLTREDNDHPWRMYCDTEWKEWKFEIRPNRYLLLFNPETRKFLLNVNLRLPPFS